MEDKKKIENAVIHIAFAVEIFRLAMNAYMINTSKAAESMAKLGKILKEKSFRCR